MRQNVNPILRVLRIMRILLILLIRGRSPHVSKGPLITHDAVLAPKTCQCCENVATDSVRASAMFFYFFTVTNDSS